VTIRIKWLRPTRLLQVTDGNAANAFDYLRRMLCQEIVHLSEPVILV